MLIGSAFGEGRTFIIGLLIFSGSLAASAQTDFIQFSTTQYAALENSGSVAIELVRTGLMTDYASLEVRTETGSAGTNDFQSFSRTVILAPGQSNLTIITEIFNDTLVEGDEWFEIILSDPDPFCCQLGAITRADVRIQENDLGVQFAAAAYSVREDAGELQINVSRLGDLTNESCSITLEVVEEDARNGVDFILQTNNVAFLAGQTNATITISILNDAVPGGNKYFGLYFEEDSDPSCCSLGAFRSTEVWISDNDYGVQFARSTYEGREGERPGEATPIEVHVQRIGDPTNEFTVDLGFSGSAIAGRDFILSTNRLFFPSGQSNVASFTVSILDDPFAELMWVVDLYLTNVTGGIPLGATSVCRISIYDNEYSGGFRFWLSSTQLSVLENGPTSYLTVFRGGDSSSTRSVDLIMDASIAGLDCIPSLGTLTFQPLEITKRISFQAINDCHIEPNEIVQIALSNPSAGTLISQPASAKLIVLDDDTAGSLDSFAPSLDWIPFRGECPFFSGVSNSTVALQPDGKILIERYGTLTRVNNEGSQDTTWLQAHPSTCSSYPGRCPVVCHIPSIVIQPNGKILVAGFTSIFRLHADGTQDTNFLVSVRKVIWGGIGHWISYPANVTALLLQPDGRILAVGDFNRVNDLPCNGVARLNPDSTVDVEFTVNAHAMDWVPGTAALQTDGKLLVGGPSLARLNPDGTRDMNFTFENGAGKVQAIAILPDQNILIGTESGSGKALARIHPDGSLETNFNPVIVVEGSALRVATALAIAKDGSILVAGQFGDGATRVVKLDSQGSLVPSFNSGLRFSGSINSIIEQPDDGELLVAGSFESVAGVPRPGIARLVSERSHMRLSAPTLGSDGALRIATGSHVGETYVLQKSSDLGAWINVSTNSAFDCSLELIDPSPWPETGFYRVSKLD
jgi:uncharacterized delta-60 repeat protein